MSTKPQASESPSPVAQALRLLRPFWPTVTVAMLMSVASGLGTAALLAAINRALHEPGGLARGLLVGFAGLCVLTVGAETITGIGNSLVGQRLVAALRKEISAQILCAPIAAIERYKVHRLLTTLGPDIDTVSAFTFNVSGLAISGAITLACFGYLAVLSPGLFALALAAIVVGVVIHHYAGREWSKNYAGVRDAQDELQRHYEALCSGAKELRMNRDRRARLYQQQLSGAVDRIRDAKSRAMRVFWGAHALGSVLFFVVIGAALGLQGGALHPEVLSGFALVLLYVKAPLEQLVNQLPAIGEARVSFERIAELQAAFQSPEPPLLPAAALEPCGPFQELELCGAGFTFPDGADSAAFQLGPIQLRLSAGETLFLTGENGCGKTTLLKLLLGLYEPSSGQLLCNGRVVGPERRDAYRQLFSTIFFDYYLFEDLVLPASAPREQLEHYLSRLELTGKVSIRDGVFSTTDLSAGQRKRLALIQVYLEQRPIVVFDEWAAEQDPTFRRVFYTEILPDLKRQGKTLIVVSHDDRYFDAADRRLLLHGGRIVEDVRNTRREGEQFTRKSLPS